MKKVFFLLGYMLLTGCETVVDLYRDEASQPVMNCLLCPDSSRIRIDLKYSAKISSYPNFVAEKKAQISLTEEGQLVARARFDSLHEYYLIDYQVKPSCKYQVMATLPSGDCLKGETQIPLPPAHSAITIDTTRYSFRITNRWHNISGELQYYWIYAYGHWPDSQEILMHNLGCTSPLADPFNVDIDSDFNPPMQYDGYMRIESPNDPETPISVTYTFSRGDETIWAHLVNADKNYDLYLKAYISNKLYREDVYELPIQYDPSYTYSNIEGGAGIVGSYCGICEKYQETHANPEDSL